MILSECVWHARCGIRTREWKFTWIEACLGGQPNPLRLESAAGLDGGVRLFGADPGAPDARMQALMSDAFSSREVTAWVAVTDALAIRALSWLAGKGVRPGRDLSVAGFDDSPDAFLHSLTSYNFNCEATVHAMLAHLVGRRMTQSGKNKREIVEIEGFVTPRSSTGRPRWINVV